MDFLFFLTFIESYKDCIINNTINGIKYFKFYTHKILLSEQSEYFKSINTADSNLYLEKKTNEIVLTNVDYISFYHILYYCYYGTFPNEDNYNIYDYISIVMEASRFIFNDIIDYCEKRLSKIITKSNAHEIFEFAKVTNRLKI